MIVAELLDGFGSEVVEVLERAFDVRSYDPFGVPNSTWLMARQGRRWRRMTSFSNDPTVVSARALSKASPTEPSEGSTPSSMSSWVKATEVH